MRCGCCGSAAATPRTPAASSSWPSARSSGSRGASPTCARSTRDVLADVFKKSESVGYQIVNLEAADRERLEKKLGYAVPKSKYTFFVARTGARVDGYALIDDEKGEHLPITFAVKLSPDGVVERQEIVAYREPRGDEVRDDRFRKQFVGKSARDPIAAGLDIVAVSGATISSRAM